MLGRSGLLARLEAAVDRLEKLGADGGIPIENLDGGKNVSSSVASFDELLHSRMSRFLAAADKIGGQVLQTSQMLQRGFEAEKGIVLAISQCQQPDRTSLLNLVQPLGDAIAKADALTGGRKTEFFNHLKAVAESMSALYWVVYTGKDCGTSLPVPHVEEIWETAEFYSNKVIMEYKNKDENHGIWAKALKELYVPGLRDYVKRFHATGPTWNPKGITVSRFSSGGKPNPPPPPPKAPPLPPAPLGPPSLPPSAPSSSSAGAPLSMSAIFTEINKGEAVTTGLKKVTDDMKTKNRTDRSGAVPASQTPQKEVAGCSVAASSKIGTPKFELQLDRKWVVEHQMGNNSLVIDNCNSRQSVYIFNCKNSVVQVKGKVNNITVDKCTKTGLVFTDVVAACEIVNCTSVEVQCQGTAPTIAVDNTNGCQLYLGKNSLNASITTAKSSEINVLVPGATEAADPVEHALPEQFVHSFQDGQFVTTAVTHSGG